MTKIKYTKKMKDFVTGYGLEVKPVTKGKYSPEAIQFLQDQNDEYEFTIEGVPMDPLFNMNGSNPYVGSGSMEDIPYDDVENMYMD